MQIFARRILANGGILERCQVKVNLKRIFLTLFYVTGAKWAIFTVKRSTNLVEKTLAGEENCKISQRRVKKWTRWSKFTIQ
ncbi:TPA: hypothetical protein ACTYBL_003806 [Klebsiella aerogenes]